MIMEKEQLLSFYDPLTTHLSFSPPPLLLQLPPHADADDDHYTLLNSTLAHQYWSCSSPPFLSPAPADTLHCTTPYQIISPQFSSDHALSSSNIPPHTQFLHPSAAAVKSADSSTTKKDWLSSLSQGRVPTSISSSFPTMQTDKPADRMQNCERAPDVAIDAHHELKLQAACPNAHSVVLRLSDVMAALIRGTGTDLDPPHSSSDRRIPPDQELGCHNNEWIKRPELILRQVEPASTPSPKKSRKAWRSEGASSKLLDKAPTQLPDEETRKGHIDFGCNVGNAGHKRDIHSYAERERRKGMSHAYATLRSLLPKRKIKHDRCSVLTEATQYIQDLLEQLDELGKQKAEVLAAEQKAGVQEKHNISTEVATTGTANCKEGSSKYGRSEAGSGDEKADSHACDHDDEDGSLVVNEELGEVIGVRLRGEDAFITVSHTFKKRGSWSSLLEVLQQLGVHIHNVTFSASRHYTHHSIHAKVPSGCEMDSNSLQRCLGKFVSGAQKSNL